MRDRWVHFKIRDVYLPDPSELTLALHGDDILQGRVVDVSDNQTEEGAYVVVEAEGIKNPLIVPLKRILGVL